ncbi:MAG: hypothetical protein L3J28_01815 [Candidatus Polarisedimenticolaceae bacterium]|nr:hypothetical protein [Candidatus Polarisedimenticolaceae bacterium]
MNKRLQGIHLHMGCGEPLDKEPRKDQRHKVNEQSDGVSIARPVVVKKSPLKACP